VAYKEPTPPDTELIIRSKVASLKDNTPGLGKVSVEVSRQHGCGRAMPGPPPRPVRIDPQ